MDQHRPCPSCGATGTEEVPCPEGPHHSKLTCAGCGRFLRWSPRPDAGVPLSQLATECCARLPTAELQGTPSQLSWAGAIRSRMLAEARRSDDLARMVVLRSIADATWFIANRDRPLDALRWPAEEQLATAPDAPTL